MLLEKKCIHAKSSIQSPVNVSLTVCSLHPDSSTYGLLARFHFTFASWILSISVCIFDHKICNKLFMHIAVHFPLFDKIVTSMKIEPRRRRRQNNGYFFGYVQCAYATSYICEFHSIIVARWHISQSNFSSFWSYRVVKSTSAMGFLILLLY